MLNLISGRATVRLPLYQTLIDNLHAVRNGVQQLVVWMVRVNRLPTPPRRIDTDTQLLQATARQQFTHLAQ